MIKIYSYGEVPNSEIFAREESISRVSDTVTDIIRTVREQGDAALFSFCEKFDGAKLSALEVSDEEIEEAIAGTEEDSERRKSRSGSSRRAYSSR